MSWMDHTPHIPSPEELAAAGPADALQEHEVYEAQHERETVACYEMPARRAPQSV
jgi:hypothetical protein